MAKDPYARPSRRNHIIVIVEYDPLSSPDEVARIQAETATLYTGVVSAWAKAFTPERAAAIRKLLEPSDRSASYEFRQIRGDSQPVAAESVLPIPARTPEPQPFPGDGDAT